MRQLYLDYAEHLTKLSRFELAAKCLLAGGQPQKAVRTLSRRGTLDAYDAAYRISALNSADGCTGEAALAGLCGCQCQEQGLWDRAAGYFAGHAGELDGLTALLHAERAVHALLGQADGGAAAGVAVDGGSGGGLAGTIIALCQAGGLQLAEQTPAQRLLSRVESESANPRRRSCSSHGVAALGRVGGCTGRA